jgi:hypothetical protein
MPYALAATSHVWQATRLPSLSWLTHACRWVRRNVLIDFRLQQVQRLDLNRLVLPVQQKIPRECAMRLIFETSVSGLSSLA